MGGLKKHIPITHLTFLLGTLAIVGFPLFSGFFSKDEILAHAYEHNPVLWVIGVVGAAMTTFYMFRLYFLTFKGTFRGTHEQEHHLHESPKSMTIPLIVLAVFSVLGGFFGVPAIIGEKIGIHNLLEHFLEPVFEHSSIRMSHHLPEATELALMGIAITVMFASLYYAYTVYVKKKTLPADEEEQLSPIHKLVYNKYWIDELYENLITKPLNFISEALYKLVDNQIVDGIVNGFGVVVTRTSQFIRLAQTGNIGFYVFAMVAGIILILLTRLA
jgi:NADH-quinone oxidoreductase subunit L